MNRPDISIAVALLLLPSCAGCGAVAESLLTSDFPDYSARCVDGFKTKQSDPDNGCKGHGGVDQRYLPGQN